MNRSFAAEAVMDVGGPEPFELHRCKDLHQIGVVPAEDRTFIRQLLQFSKRECSACSHALFILYKKRIAEERKSGRKGTSYELDFLSEMLDMCLRLPKATLIVRVMS